MSSETSPPNCSPTSSIVSLLTSGAPVWGRDAALKRFEALYQGTWKL